VLYKQVSTQVGATDDTIKEFIRRGPVSWDIGIPKMMDIYTRCIEPLAPVINLIRVGLELRRGVSSPQKQCTLRKNIEILKLDPDYGSLFGCLDEQIRHGDAHCSVEIKGNEVLILDLRPRKPKLVRTYKCDELARVALVMQQELFPALAFTLVLHEMAMLDLVLISKEYKLLLAAVGNC
jgi:hypothetical protein